MLSTKLFDADRISKELYASDGFGGLSLPGFLEPASREMLLTEIERNTHLFRAAPRAYLKAVQEFDFFHIGEKDDDRVHGDLDSVLMLRESYSQLVSAVAIHAQFLTSGYPNSITVQRYHEGSAGITPHLDESRYINLISIFVLAGEAPFCICADRQKSSTVELSGRPGDLILLRAPRDRHDPEERKRRPMHFVGRVVRERYSLTFREHE